MKTLHPVILGIITSIVIGLAIFAIFSTNLIRLTDAPQNNSRFYTVIDTPGLQNTYYVNQAINFSVIIHGYGIYPCIQPDVSIYNNITPGNPVFHDNQGVLSCKAVYREQPENFTISYPSKNDSYVTRLNQTGNYTLNISIGNESVQSYFSIIPSKITSIFDTGVTPMSVNVTNTNFTINYNITGSGKILDAKMDAQSQALIVLINATEDGQLVIVLPRNMIHATTSTNMDDVFIILDNNQEIQYKEVHNTLDARTLLISFQKGINKIEIIGTNPI
ncbi:MAG TPA: hypothetical protein VES63_00070 [Candidatus Acidoferrum sp.]|nr:hypothetical protein [Candidatus Acidoferrum sp.]